MPELYSNFTILEIGFGNHDTIFNIFILVVIAAGVLMFASRAILHVHRQPDCLSPQQSKTTFFRFFRVSFFYRNQSFRVVGNRLLNWPKLLRLYDDGFYSIFVPECVPYIIPHMFQ